MQNGVSSVQRRAAWREMPPAVRTTVWASLALSAAGVLAAEAILHNTSWITREPAFPIQFALHDLQGSALCGIIIVLAAVASRRELVPLRAVECLDRYRRPLAAALVILLALGTLTVYHNYPLSLDEFAQLFQAKLFAAGRLSATYPPALVDWLLPYTKAQFLANQTTGRAISWYWPGFSLLETPFVWIGAPWLLNPLLGAATLLLLRRLAAELYPGTNAPAWAMLFALASPVFLIQSLSYYSMPAQLCLNLLFTVLVLRLTPRALVAAGLVGSLALVQSQPVPHMFYAIPWLAWAVAQRRGWKSLFWLVLGYLPLSVLLGLGWIVVRIRLSAGQTGQAQTIWEWVSALAGAAVAADLPYVMAVRALALLKLAAWAMPGLLILSILGAQKGWRDSRIKVLAASALVTFFGYFLFKFSQGHGWGYRYFHGAWGTLPLLAAGVVAGTPEDVRRSVTRVARFATVLAVASLVLLTSLRLVQVNNWMGYHLAQLPPLDATRAQVCFVHPLEGFYSIDLVQNDPFLRQETLFMKSHGRKTEKTFMELYFPGAAPRSNDPNEAVWYVERDKVDWWVHGTQ